MSDDKKPKLLTLEFPSNDHLEWWLSWYLENGEQVAEYMVGTGSKWRGKNRHLKLVPMGDTCSQCASMNLTADEKRIAQLAQFHPHAKLVQPGQLYCEDCGHIEPNCE